MLRQIYLLISTLALFVCFAAGTSPLWGGFGALLYSIGAPMFTDLTIDAAGAKAWWFWVQCLKVFIPGWVIGGAWSSLDDSIRKRMQWRNWKWG